jgi:dihydroxy-acid dehydratase
MNSRLNKYSATITQNEALPAAQAMLYGIGLSEQDLQKAQVGIVSTGFEGNTCNMHLNSLAKLVKEGISEQPELLGLIFHTIGVSDGMSMGTKGMHYSLPSRDVIADSVETVVNAQWYDGVVAVAGCDKNMPGAVMALGRLNRPGLLVYGGSIASGKYKEEKLNIVSAFEALGQKVAGKLSQEDFKCIIQNACPGAGACGGMYTANTMATAIETLGMSLPYSSSNPANGADKVAECLQVGRAIRHLLQEDIRPIDIMTLQAFENATTMVMALGGSTNAVLHLIALAKSVGVPFGLKDIQRISDKTPVIADMKPSGKYLMEDIHAIGGTPAIIRLLFEAGYLHGDCLTVTGKTLRENIEDFPALKQQQQVILPLSQPIKSRGNLQILYGNLATEGAVAKISGKEGEKFSGPARVFDSEEAANAAIQQREIKEGEVLVIRYEGPRGGPGMREMLKPTSLLMGAQLGSKVALITDGRFSGGTHGFVVGHITPEAYEGGTIALVQDGDPISIDAVNNRIEVDLSGKELSKRKAAWRQPAPRVSKGALYKYMKCVSPASEGCVTDE